MGEIHGWGRYPRVAAHETRDEDLLRASREPVLFRGLGRSYGDASLPARAGGRVVSTSRADRILAFDAASGVLRAEAGLSLAELGRVFLPRGFAPPVVPGTAFVTLGGMVACDVHGKNHHSAGTFGNHVRELRLRVADGRVLDVSETSEAELFAATLGGMGLTGQILEVELSLKPVPSPWLRSQTRAYPDIDALLVALREASTRVPYTMAWSDTTARGASLGRGVLISGDWAEPVGVALRPFRYRAPLEFPIDLPSGLIAPFTTRIFNAGWFALQRRMGERLVSPRGFFHPLDGIGHWNRAYGRRGFVQYQCVVPIESDPGIVRRLFELLVELRGASIVTVVKDFGAQGRGLLSFPRPGITLALDLPMRGSETRRLVDRLNDEVAAAGGRIYLAKDALTRREHFVAMETRLAAWNEVRRKWDPEARLRSALSVRLLGDEP
ncbi:MAG: FAD-binding oxidoreductase [Myxococcota bacterium]